MTKLVSLAAATLALAASVGAASAENTFSLDRARSTASALSLTNVEADQAGRIDVFSYDGGNIGTFLGHARIGAGVNGDVEVALERPAQGRLLVVMMNSNHSVAKMDVRRALAD